MRSLSRVVKQGLKQGEALPTAYKKLEDAGIYFRKSDLHMIAGKPGQGKTFLALNLAFKTEVPTLYFSNDSNEVTVASRTISYFTGTPTREVESRLDDEKEKASELLARRVPHIRWCFDSAPTLKDLEEELEAFRELYGAYPACTIVDILMLVNYAEDSEHATASRVMAFLKHLARSCGTAMVVVHHCSEADAQGRSMAVCPPLSAVQQKVNQFPALVLTVANEAEKFFIAPVKSRGSLSEPSGRTALAFQWEPTIARISE